MRGLKDMTTLNLIWYVSSILTVIFIVAGISMSDPWMITIAWLFGGVAAVSGLAGSTRKK